MRDPYLYEDVAVLRNKLDIRQQELLDEAEADYVVFRLKDLALKKDLLLCFINRNGKIILPNGQDSIQVGDTVMVVTTHTGFNDLKDILA